MTCWRQAFVTPAVPSLPLRYPSTLHSGLHGQNSKSFARVNTVRLTPVSTLNGLPDPNPPTSRRRPDLLSSFPLPLLPSLVSVARFIWSTMWRIMMSELAPSTPEGDYLRPSNAIPPAKRLPARSVLFVGLACPWCHRVLLARALALPKASHTMDVVYLQPGQDGLWGLAPDETHRWHASRLREIYAQAAPGYVGRATAPLLVRSENSTAIPSSTFDPKPEGSRSSPPSPNEGSALANDSADILALIANEGHLQPTWFGESKSEAAVAVWLRPNKDNEFGIDPDRHDRLCERIYNHVNNGVYKTGFATTQAAYERAERMLFCVLDEIEELLQESRFLLSPIVITEADIRLFPTIYRFDAVYRHLFNACRKSVTADYPAISSWMRDVYSLPGVMETCDLTATHHNYYSSLFPLNPSGIVPIAPIHDLSRPHNREGLGMRKER